MESGEISSEQISASSQYNSNWSPERSRLNYQENGWTPSDDTVREWIQVCLHLFFLWRILEILATEIMSRRSSFPSLISTFAHSRRNRVPPLELDSYRGDRAHIWSEYCSLICTTFSARYKDTEGEQKNKATCIIY